MSIFNTILKLDVRYHTPGDTSLCLLRPQLSLLLHILTPALLLLLHLYSFTSQRHSTVSFNLLANHEEICEFTNILIIVTTTGGTKDPRRVLHSMIPSYLHKNNQLRQMGIGFSFRVVDYTRPHVFLLGLWAAGIFMVMGEARHVWSL